MSELNRAAFFDIPQQSLDAALVAFARASGVDVVYDEHVTYGHQSSEVKGQLHWTEALDRLLWGTGLTVRFVRANAVLIVAAAHSALQGTQVVRMQTVMRLDTLDVRGEPLRIGGHDYRDYVSRVSADLARQLRDVHPERLAPVRATMRLWIGSQGEVERFGWIDGSGDPRLDRAIESKLRGAVVADTPPVDLPQPLRFEFRIQ